MTEKITSRHLERPAVIYVRQSTPQQVSCNEESRRLQYSMKERLHDLGWSEVEVIDDDLGRTASGTAQRPGFERMVTRVSLGEIGALALAVGTTALARDPLPTIALKPKPVAPLLRAAYSPAAATSISETPGATAARMAS